MKNDKSAGKITKELCDKYGFKTRFAGINDNFYCEVYAKNTDGKDVIWFEIQLSNHDSAEGIPFEPIITIYGNTDQKNIWLCDTRKDLSLENIIDFCKAISEICNCKLTTTPSTKNNEIYIHRLVDIEDLQEIKGFKSLDDISQYINKETQNKENKTKKYNNLHSIVSDIADIANNKISVNLDIYSDFKVITSYKIELDLSKMGLTSNMDYEFQLSKDLSNKIEKYYDKNDKLPSIKELENEMHQINYFIIEKPDLEENELEYD